MYKLYGTLLRNSNLWRMAKPLGRPKLYRRRNSSCCIYCAVPAGPCLSTEIRNLIEDIAHKLSDIEKMALRLGRKHVELATKWLPSALTYGTSASLALLYFTDWKVVVQYIPFYGSKFDDKQ